MQCHMGLLVKVEGHRSINTEKLKGKKTVTHDAMLKTYVLECDLHD
jgi:hypothetical protein